MKKKILFLLFVGFLLASCSYTKTVQPQTPNEYLAYEKATMTALYTQLATMTNNKVLTTPQAQTIFNNLNNAEKDVNLAELLIKEGKPTDAQSSLIDAQTILIGVSNILYGTGGK